MQEPLKGFTCHLFLYNFVDENFQERIRIVNDIASEWCFFELDVQWEIVLNIEVENRLAIIKYFQASNSLLRFHVEFNAKQVIFRYFLCYSQCITLLYLST